MTVLITMAGAGSRFARDGYTVPKYKIGARGRTLFEWSMLSVRGFFDQRFVLATLAGDDQDWLVKTARQLGIRDCATFARAALSSGQAETAFDALGAVAQHEPLWIYNIDTYVAAGMQPSDMDGCDGCLHVFHSTDPGMSFVRYGESGAVAEIAEKRVISNWATVGMYGFASARAYADTYRAAYGSAAVQTVRGERYVAPMYDWMLQQGQRISAPHLQAAEVHILGTPAQLLAFDPHALAPVGNLG